MCALQMQAEHASTLLHDEEALVQSIETFITKQVCGMMGGWVGG